MSFLFAVSHRQRPALGICREEIADVPAELVRLRAVEPVITSIAIMDPSSSTATDTWSITSWLSSNPNYIAVLLVAIILPLILFVDRIGINPTVAAGPTAKSKSPSSDSKKEAKKNK